MTRKVVIAFVAACATTAILLGPAALAQQYGDDVYGGTEQGGATEEPAAPAEEPTASTAVAKKTAAAWTKLSTSLSGDNEVPSGDADGSGSAAVKVRGTEICYDVRWSGIEAVAAHIHKAPAGKNGDVLVPFFANEEPLGEQRKQGCAKVSAAVAKAIAARPQGYYVNVHSPQFPKGAIRGQLAMGAAAGGGQLPYTGGSRSRGLALLGLCVIAAGSSLIAYSQRRRRPAHARR